MKAILMLLMIALPAVAHHSVQAEFDLEKPITISGKVTKVEWINPHSYLYMDVTDDKGNVKELHAIRVGPPPKFEPIPGTEFTLQADLVLLAMGFTGPVKSGLVEQLGLELNVRGNIHTDDHYQTSVPNVFAAGDSRRGQSLVVWAIAEGRKAARAIDMQLMGATKLKS